MPTCNVLTGVLCGFLGTYTSRYSQFKGYWLFGFLVTNHPVLEFDLLGRIEGDSGGPLASADTRAKVAFAQQLGKAGLAIERVREARLVIERLAEDCSVSGEQSRRGYNLRFRATVIADTGRRFEREKVVFVAPHDPRLELRSDVRDPRVDENPYAPSWWAEAVGNARSQTGGRASDIAVVFGLIGFIVLLIIGAIMLTA